MIAIQEVPEADQEDAEGERTGVEANLKKRNKKKNNKKRRMKVEMREKDLSAQRKVKEGVDMSVRAGQAVEVGGIEYLCFYNNT